MAAHGASVHETNGRIGLELIGRRGEQPPSSARLQAATPWLWRWRAAHGRDCAACEAMADGAEGGGVGRRRRRARGEQEREKEGEREVVLTDELGPEWETKVAASTGGAEGWTGGGGTLGGS